MSAFSSNQSFKFGNLEFDNTGITALPVPRPPLSDAFICGCEEDNTIQIYNKSVYIRKIFEAFFEFQIDKWLALPIPDNGKTLEFDTTSRANIAKLSGINPVSSQLFKYLAEMKELNKLFERKSELKNGQAHDLGLTLEGFNCCSCLFSPRSGSRHYPREKHHQHMVNKILG